MELNWMHAVLLGLGLAASTGLNTFLPLLMLALAAHFNVFDVNLGEGFVWLSSDAALAALGIASLVEVVGDKIPVVDHALDTVGTVARPAAGALAAASVFGGDPTTAALLGLVIGAPTAFGFHVAKASTRVGASATTFGVANPILSVIEDALAVGISLLSLAFPWLVPVALVLLALLAVKMFRTARSAAQKARGVFKKPRAA